MRLKSQEALFLRKLFFKSRHEKGRGTYGTRRLKTKLAGQDIIASRRRIGRPMNQAGLWCKTKKKFKVTTDSKHNKPIAPNLLERQFSVLQPDRYYMLGILLIFIPKRTGYI